MGVEGGITVRVDPERQRLLAELAEVHQELAEARIERADLENRITAFAALHDRMVAPLYAELDAVRADIAELLAERSGLADDRADAARARQRADRSSRTARAAAGNRAGSRRFEAVTACREEPSEQARGRFRALIKRCHPDLAADDTDRARRESFTRLVNDAYADGAVHQLEQLAQQWDTEGADPAVNGATAGELAASIAATRAELIDVRGDISSLGASGLGRLLLGAVDPSAAVDTVAAVITAEIDRQRATLRRLRPDP
jgi:ElaB/YqjD/DUF883 family membrane-anchored ribosome-binding protein